MKKRVLKKSFKGQKIVLIGGTGSMGQEIMRTLANSEAEIVSISRNQNTIALLRSEFPQVNFISIADIARIENQDLQEYLQGADAVIHLAAQKHVGEGEKDPILYLQTNNFGLDNVLKAARRTGVPKVLVIASDKAVAPDVCYGNTKAIQVAQARADDKANIAAGRKTRVAAAIYGNILDSAGSAVSLWKSSMRKNRPCFVINPNHTRYYITLKEGAEFVLKALVQLKGGEVFIPKNTNALTTLGLFKKYIGDKPHQILNHRGISEKPDEALLSPNNLELNKLVSLGEVFALVSREDTAYKKQSGIEPPPSLISSSLAIERGPKSFYLARNHPLDPMELFGVKPRISLPLPEPEKAKQARLKIWSLALQAACKRLPHLKIVEKEGRLALLDPLAGRIVTWESGLLVRPIPTRFDVAYETEYSFALANQDDTYRKLLGDTYYTVCLHLNPEKAGFTRRAKHLLDLPGEVTPYSAAITRSSAGALLKLLGKGNYTLGKGHSLTDACKKAVLVPAPGKKFQYEIVIDPNTNAFVPAN